MRNHAVANPLAYYDMTTITSIESFTIRQPIKLNKTGWFQKTGSLDPFLYYFKTINSNLNVEQSSRLVCNCIRFCKLVFQIYQNWSILKRIETDYQYCLPQNILYLHQGSFSKKCLHFPPLLIRPLGLWLKPSTMAF